MRRILAAVVLGTAFLVVGDAMAQASPGNANASSQAPPRSPGKVFDVDGRPMHLFCTGTGGPLVVIIAGVGGRLEDWRTVQNATSAFTRTCYYDRAGYGWSASTAPHRSFDARTEDLRKLLAAAGEAGPYVLVGHSYGGILARRFVALHPSKVAGVVLVESVEELEMSDPRILAEEASADQRYSQDEEQIIRSHPEMADGLRRFFDTLRDEEWSVIHIPEAMRTAGAFGRLGDRPLVVISRGLPSTPRNEGADAAWTDAQARLTHLSTDVRQVVADKSGHNVQVEQPQVIVQAVHDVVEKVRARYRRPS